VPGSIAAEVEAYFAVVGSPHRAPLLELRALLAGLLPEADQVIAYGVPTFKVAGKGVAGLGVYRDHCTYFPMSGAITTLLADQLAGYQTAKGSIRFSAEQPLTEALVARLVAARREEIARIGR
jgi:uncharacterized protein YdhG (YjbR/CyaY superfamily)